MTDFVSQGEYLIIATNSAYGDEIVTYDGPMPITEAVQCMMQDGNEYNAAIMSHDMTAIRNVTEVLADQWCSDNWHKVDSPDDFNIEDWIKNSKAFDCARSVSGSSNDEHRLDAAEYGVGKHF